MKTLDYTLLDAQKVQPVAAALRQLLADVQVYYTNLRDFHWNIQGANFYNLHVEFENLYNGIATKADDIAERLLQLGETPEHRYSEYLKIANVKEAEVTHCGNCALTQVLETEKLLIAQERVVLEAAQEAGDETTVAMVSDWLREQEKLVWMLVATLKQDCEDKK